MQLFFVSVLHANRVGLFGGFGMLGIVVVQLDACMKHRCTGWYQVPTLLVSLSGRMCKWPKSGQICCLKIV